MPFPAFIVRVALICTGFSGFSGAGLPGPAQPFCAGEGNIRGDRQLSGISGTVYLLSGNQMPAPRRRSRPAIDTPNSTRPGVKATVCIFPLTSDSQVVRPAGSGSSSSYYQAILTHLIRQVETDDKGGFQVMLPPGTYSVFTKKGDLFYATQRDEKNNIAPVKVLPGKITRIKCSVESDHSVVY